MSRRERETAADDDEADQPKRGAALNAKVGKVSAAQGALVLHAAALREVLGGRPLEALACCQQALAIDPENPETMHLMGIVYTEAKQFDHAVEWASRAIRKDPKPAYLTTLGVALLKLRRHDDALKALDKAVQLKPDDPEPWWQMGNVLIDTGRSSEALLCLERTLRLNPQHGDAVYQAGHILHGLKRFEEALAYFDRSARLRPDHALTLYMRALVLKELNRLEEALVANQRAIELDGANADACNNMGAILGALGRFEEALSWYDRSLELRPDVVRTIMNKGGALFDLGRLDEAMKAYNRAVAIDPGYAEAVWNRSLLHLQTGNFEAGWKEREMSRSLFPDLIAGYPKFSAPMWLGEEPVAGKTIIVCQDQGLGDVIHFARYVPLLAARGAHVILVVDPPLCPLLSALSGVSQCLPKLSETQLPQFDFHIPIDNLPLAFGTQLDSIPAAETYLPPPDTDKVQAWESRLGPHGRLRVGLVWSGNPKHTNDHNRSMPLQLMCRLLQVEALFVSLQKDPRPQDAKLLRETPDIVDHTRDLTDLAETAALVSCLDLVITVDTSVAHLAAALGRPTWILLPSNPDFRWMLNRDDSPWYPTVRLFRQSRTREYGSVIERVRDELLAEFPGLKRRSDETRLLGPSSAGNPSSLQRAASFRKL
jgi:tetratricopeptide (TPR) repeat protein/ADP-heptose:LPS heptosyltransferase